MEIKHDLVNFNQYLFKLTNLENDRESINFLSNNIFSNNWFNAYTKQKFVNLAKYLREYHVQHALTKTFAGAWDIGKNPSNIKNKDELQQEINILLKDAAQYGSKMSSISKQFTDMLLNNQFNKEYFFAMVNSVKKYSTNNDFIQQLAKVVQGAIEVVMCHDLNEFINKWQNINDENIFYNQIEILKHDLVTCIKNYYDEKKMKIKKQIDDANLPLQSESYTKISQEQQNKVKSQIDKKIFILKKIYDGLLNTREKRLKEETDKLNKSIQNMQTLLQNIDKKTFKDFGCKMDDVLVTIKDQLCNLDEFNSAQGLDANYEKCIGKSFENLYNASEYYKTYKKIEYINNLVNNFLYEHKIPNDKKRQLNNALPQLNNAIYAKNKDLIKNYYLEINDILKSLRTQNNRMNQIREISQALQSLVNQFK